MWSGLVDQYKKDLNEFVSTVKGDTSEVLKRAAEKISLNTEDDTANKEEASQVGESFEKPSDSGRVETFLDKFLENPEIILEDETENDTRFQQFSSEFSLLEEGELITELMRDNERVESIYHEYVPSKITHKQFWERYFYLESQLRLSRHRVGEIQMQEEDLTWGASGDDVWDDNVIGDVANINGEETEIESETKDIDLKKALEDAQQEIKELKAELAQTKTKHRSTVGALKLENEALKESLAQLKKTSRADETNIDEEKTVLKDSNTIILNTKSETENKGEAEKRVLLAEREDEDAEDADVTKSEDENEKVESNTDLKALDNEGQGWEEDGWGEWE